MKDGKDTKYHKFIIGDMLNGLCSLIILDLNQYLLVGNKVDLEEYEIKSASNIRQKKCDLEEIEIKSYLLKKGYKQDNINRAFEKEEKE